MRQDLSKRREGKNLIGQPLSEPSSFPASLLPVPGFPKAAGGDTEPPRGTALKGAHPGERERSARWGLRTGGPAPAAGPGLWLTRPLSRGNEQRCQDQTLHRQCHCQKTEGTAGLWVREEFREGGDGLWKEL